RARRVEESIRVVDGRVVLGVLNLKGDNLGNCRDYASGVQGLLPRGSHAVRRNLDGHVRTAHGHILPGTADGSTVRPERQGRVTLTQQVAGPLGSGAAEMTGRQLYARRNGAVVPTSGVALYLTLELCPTGHGSPTL